MEWTVYLPSSGAILGTRIRWARGIGERFVGLMGTRELPRGAGLLFPHTNAVHGFFMRYPIQLLYIGRDQTILAKAALPPWRIGPIVRGAYYVLELPVGVADAVSIGERVEWKKTGKTS